MFSTAEFMLGDILILEHQIPGIPYNTGAFVLCSVTWADAFVSLVSGDANGLYATDNQYKIPRKCLGAFTHTGERARLQKNRGQS